MGDLNFRCRDEGEHSFEVRPDSLSQGNVLIITLDGKRRIFPYDCRNPPSVELLKNSQHFGDHEHCLHDAREAIAALIADVTSNDWTPSGFGGC